MISKLRDHRSEGRRALKIDTQRKAGPQSGEELRPRSGCPSSCLTPAGVMPASWWLARSEPMVHMPITTPRPQALPGAADRLMARYQRTIACSGFYRACFSFIMIDQRKGFANCGDPSCCWCRLVRLESGTSCEETFAHRASAGDPGATFLRATRPSDPQESATTEITPRSFITASTWTAGAVTQGPP